MSFVDSERCPTCGHSLSGSSEQEPKNYTWKKVLYERSPYPDNYVDPDEFLKNLRLNATVTYVDFKTVFRNSVAVTQEISTVSLFGIVWYLIYLGTITTSVLIFIDIALAVAGFLFFKFVLRASISVGSIGRSTLVAMALLCFSPVLQTLTSPISDDTIAAMTIILLAIHLFSFDYVYCNAIIPKLRGTIALNAAFSSAILLASRLATSVHVFAFMLLAVELFSLFPILRHCLMAYSVDAHWLTTWLLFVLTCAALFQISTAVLCAYLGVECLVTFVCPLWLTWMQRYKSEIHGPWDEARPNLGRMKAMLEDLT